MVPAGRVERRSGERLAALDLRQLRAVELTDGADDRVGRDGPLVAVGVDRAHRPRRRVLVPLDRGHLGVEADVRADAELVDALAEVLVELGARAVVERPVVALGERVAVVVVRDVDPAPGIAVLQPGAADVGVLVQHDVRHVGLGQAVGGDDAGHAGADDDDLEVAVRVDVVLVPPGRPQVGRQGQLLAHHRQVLVDLLAAGHVLEDVLEGGAGRHGRRDAAAVAERDERLQRQLADGLLLLGRQAALVIAHQQRVDAQVGAQQRVVARDVGERRQQGREVGHLERGAQLVVGGGDRLDGAGQGHDACSPRISSVLSRRYALIDRSGRGAVVAEVAHACPTLC